MEIIFIFTAFVILCFSAGVIELVLNVIVSVADMLGMIDP